MQSQLTARPLELSNLCTAEHSIRQWLELEQLSLHHAESVSVAAAQQNCWMSSILVAKCV